MFTLSDLPYIYKALVPHISEQAMLLHHDKHHQGYVEKLNKVLEGHADLQEKPIEQLLMEEDAVPEDIRTVVHNNGGGHYNHSLFWQMMMPAEDFKALSKRSVLAQSIDRDFGSFEKFQEKFSESANKLFGSGWTWLVKNNSNKLSIINTTNQDTLLLTEFTPLIGVDVWEHAYYVDYQNRRADYINAWWNVVNWQFAESQLKSKGAK